MNKILLYFLIFLPYFSIAQDNFNFWPLTGWSEDSGINVTEENTIVNEGSASASVEVTTGTQASTDFQQSTSLADNSVATYQFCFDIYHTEGGMRTRIVWVDGGNNFENYSDPTIIGSWQTICTTVSSTNTITSVGLRFYDVSGFDGNEVVYVDNFVITVILPVELSYFKGQKNETSYNLSWQTLSEQNNSHFDIQRSTNSKIWETIDKITGAGTTDEVQDYTFTDKSPMTGMNYYRLRQVDYDGAFDYSPIVSVDMGKEEQVSVYPNPVIDQVIFEFDTQQKEGTVLSIYNMSGQLVQTNNLKSDASKVELNVADLVEGVYFMQVIQDNTQIMTRFVKQ